MSNGSDTLVLGRKNKVKIIDDQPGQSVRKTQSCFCLPDIVREDTML